MVFLSFFLIKRKQIRVYTQNEKTSSKKEVANKRQHKKVEGNRHFDYVRYLVAENRIPSWNFISCIVKCHFMQDLHSEQRFQFHIQFHA